MFARLLAIATFALSLSVHAQTRYISDELFVYMHSGSSNQFRIIGSVNAGEKVELLDLNSETQYAKIRMSTGREGWVEAKFLNRNPGLAEQLKAAQDALAKSEQARKSMAEDSSSQAGQQQQLIEEQTAQIETLTAQNQQLNEQFAQINDQNQDLSRRLDTRETDIQMRWMMRGGIIAIVGLIVGLIVPHLPRRKKRDNRWM
ncbi:MULTISPECIES: TIGR04211 family SH3 domain-containing protein [Aliagarivorans]|uniref:TIGR04211 family SH3 domain-containing protein n=1 Tax=Aliagarivorans TaxID=882379 RepID=UPI0004257BF0|nr:MULTISPECIES: TIGR04211 family SH3 domain-containing protein [Aliagarivorans]